MRNVYKRKKEKQYFEWFLIKKKKKKIGYQFYGEKTYQSSKFSKIRLDPVSIPVIFFFKKIKVSRPIHSKNSSLFRMYDIYLNMSSHMTMTYFFKKYILSYF